MFCWMFTEALKMNSISLMIEKLAYFYSVIILAFLIIWFIFYPLVYFIFTKRNGYKLYPKIFSAIMVAFGSTSSAITLPETMNCMENKVGLLKRVARTVLPLGMTLNMNGTSMYYPMVTMFVVQVKQMPVDYFSSFFLW